MKSYKPSDVRVVGFFGHRGAGKTSLIEMMLYDAKATQRLGSVDAGNLALELDEGALERQTTMHTNVGFLEWKDVRVTVVDTPGDGNFWGATLRGLQVVDAAVVVVNATEGVETLTLRTMQELRERNIPFAVFVTKVDKDTADLEGDLKEIREELKGKEAVQITLPIGKGEGFKGVVSLFSGNAYLAHAEICKVPDEMKDEFEAARENLFDAVAAADDDLAEKYLEEGTLTEDQLNAGLRSAFIGGDLVPIVIGSPTMDLGASPLLNLIRGVYPSPLDRPAIKGYKSDKTEEMVERIPSADGPLVAQVFRTFNDPFAGVLSFARVWSGKLGHDVFNSTKRMSDRPSHLYLPMGGTKHGVEIKEAQVGDVVVITKLKSTKTADTLTSKDDPTYLIPFAEPHALLNFGLNAEDPKDEDKVSSYVRRICEEDPSLDFHRDPETKEMLLGGLGQAHIDYVVDRLKRNKHPIVLHEPKVPYRETIRSKVAGVEGKHKKQSGGSGQYGVCVLDFEPTPRGTGIEFVDKIVGGSIPKNYIPSVEKGIRDSLHQGPISGSEIVDVQMTLYDGKYHRVDSSDMAFQAAGRKAIKALFDHPKTKPILLEPYMHLDVACPADSVGDVMGDLNSRRARVENMVTEGRRGKIAASVPMNEILRYTNVLKSITSGRGSFTMRFDRYEEAPANIRDQVAAAYQATLEQD